MNALAVPIWTEVRDNLQYGWNGQVLPFLQQSSFALTQTVTSGMTQISSSISHILNSLDHSSCLFRLVSNVSGLAQALFGREEVAQVQKPRTTTEVIHVTRCFTLLHYILGGNLTKDWQHHRFWTISSVFLWAFSDIGTTCLFLFPSLSTKKISVLNWSVISISEVGFFGDSIASCCDLAGRINKVFVDRKIALAEFFNMLSAGSDIASSFIFLFRIRAKVVVVALYVFSSLTSLLSRVVSKK